jgi:hypothetical protein
MREVLYVAKRTCAQTDRFAPGGCVQGCCLCLLDPPFCMCCCQPCWSTAAGAEAETRSMGLGFFGSTLGQAAEQVRHPNSGTNRLPKVHRGVERRVLCLFLHSHSSWITFLGFDLCIHQARWISH